MIFACAWQKGRWSLGRPPSRFVPSSLLADPFDTPPDVRGKARRRVDLIALRLRDATDDRTVATGYRHSFQSVLDGHVHCADSVVEHRSGRGSFLVVRPGDDKSMLAEKPDLPCGLDRCIDHGVADKALGPEFTAIPERLLETCEIASAEHDGG